MAFCGSCGSDVGENKSCGSCGKPVAVSNLSASQGSGPRVKGNLKTDPNQVCVKCGGTEFYTNWQNNDLYDLCAQCDIPMGLTESGRKKQRKSMVWATVIVTSIGIILVAWIGGVFDAPEPEPTAAPQPIDQPEPEDEGISFTHCLNLTSSLDVLREMLEIGDSDLISTSLALIAQDADTYASSYSGEIDHDLQVLADKARELDAWVQSDRSTEVPDFTGAFERVAAHCG